MPYKGKVVADVGAFHAPYIPLFLQEKEKKPTMFIKLRKRFISWLRATDIYDNDGRMFADKEGVEEPIRIRPDRVGAWTTAVNSMSQSKARKAARALGALSTGPVSAGPGESIDSRGITFKLFPARGGLVIETYHYDERTDSNQNTLHLIAETEDLSEALARIISMEAMRG